jgi:branched-subunit amino acid transport protein
MRTELVMLIIGTAAAAIFTRFVTLAIFSVTGMPAWLERWLKYVPVAVFSALIAPAILAPQGQPEFSPDNPYLWAGLVAVVLAWRYRNFVVTVGVGTLVMIGWRWLLQ